MSRPTLAEKHEILESLHRVFDEPGFDYLTIERFDDIPPAIVQSILIALDIMETRRAAEERERVG